MPESRHRPGRAANGDSVWEVAPAAVRTREGQA
jgi:hypothetical protein